MKKILVYIMAVVLVSGFAAAMDVNSSQAFNYYNDGNLLFQVDTDGDSLMQSSTGEDIASFSDTQIQLMQPLSVESSGPLSVENGIDLTDGTSNTIDSYSTFYLEASGSSSDIVLDPNGEVGVSSNLAVTGDIDINSNNLQNFFGSSCSDGDVMVNVNADGTYDCTDASSEVQDDYVQREGDSMFGDLTIDHDSNPSLLINEPSTNTNPASVQYSTQDGDWQTGTTSQGNFHVAPEHTGSRSGFIDNSLLTVNRGGNVEIPSGDLELSGTMISGTVPTDRLDQDSVTYGSGDHLTGGGTVALGGSSTLNVDAGSVLGSANDLDSNGNIQSGVVGVSELNTGDVDGRYVQMSGDAMSGNLDMVDNQVIFDNNQVSGETVSFEGSSSTGLRAENENGYVSLTPLNTGWAHIYTDRSDFIFNEPVSTTANEFFSYDDDLVLRDRNTDNNITIGSSIDMSTDLGMRGNNIISVNNLGASSGEFSGNIDVSGNIQGSDWASLDISQSDVSTSDLGAADSNINMNGNDITNIGFGHTNELVVSDTADESLLPATANSAYIQGDLSIDGDFIGAGADLAERMTENKDQDIESGEVVVLGENLSVERSTEAYDTGVAGVVSTDPAMIMAKERDGVELALSGTAPVKFTAENGGVEPGDLITTSSQEGKAMKCENPVECQGAIIGKAGETAESYGEIEILLTLS